MSMKSRLLLLSTTLILLVVFLNCTVTKFDSERGENTMKVSSAGINAEGVIGDKYGVNGDAANIKNGAPTLSLPIKIENAPAGTVSYAIVMEDKDAFPVSHGFSWVHWVAANITDTNIAENASRSNPVFVQGVNSWWSPQGGNQAPETVSFYGGMYPPEGDRAHIYEIHVFALDTKLDLNNGFYMNDLYRKMKGHILAETTITGTYANKGINK